MRSVRKHKLMKYELSFSNKEVTPWGGMVFLKQMLDKIGFQEQILNCSSLPQQHPIAEVMLVYCLSLSLLVFGVELIGFYIPKSHVRIGLWQKYSTGKLSLVKMLINVISTNLTKVQITK